MTFGQKCRKYRTMAKLTQQQAADSIGVSRRTYVYYETDEKLPRRKETVSRLAELFGVEYDMLMVEDDERFLELRKQRPAEERIDDILAEINELLSDSEIAAEHKDRLLSSLSAVISKQAVSGTAAPDPSGSDDLIV